MKEHEAISIAVKLKGLMPKMTEEQCRVVCEELAHFEFARARESTDRYAKANADFSMKSFISMLQTELSRSAMIDRQQFERAEELERWKKRDKETDTIISNIDCVLLPELIAQFQREFPIQRKEINPKTNAAFRAWIHDFWKKTEAGKAGAR